MAQRKRDIEQSTARRKPSRPRVRTSDKSNQKLRKIQRSNVLYEGDVSAVERKLRPGTIRYRIMMTICFLVMIGCGIAALIYFDQTGSAKSALTDISTTYTTTAVQTEEGEVVHKKDEDGLPPIVDFEGLRAVNPDVAGWLRIPGTTVDYPVMYSPEKDFYLNRDMNKEYSICGSVFIDHENTLDASQKHIVLYGHHMNWSVMFHDVALYPDEQFFNEHRNIYFETPETTYLIKPIGVYIADAQESQVRQVLQQNEEQFQNYLDERLKRNDVIYRDDYNRKTLDRLFTLVTCTNTGDTRVIVECVVEQAYPTSYVPNVISNSPDID